MSPPDALLVPQPTLEDFPDFVSIPLRLARHAVDFPDKRAVVCEGRSRSWHEFDRRINKIARTLAGMGIGKGDKIAILAGNSIEYLEIFIGGLRAGGSEPPRALSNRLSWGREGSIRVPVSAPDPGAPRSARR